MSGMMENIGAAALLKENEWRRREERGEKRRRKEGKEKKEKRRKIENRWIHYGFSIMKMHR